MIMSHAQGLRGDVVFLQETHLHCDEILNIFSHLYHSKCSFDSKPLSIWARQSCSWLFWQVWGVSGGLCSTYCTSAILASVFTPGWDDEQIRFRSSSRPYSHTSSAKLLTSTATELGLSDPWRSKFPDKKNPFLFFSLVHHSFSRIDFFFSLRQQITFYSTPMHLNFSPCSDVHCPLREANDPVVDAIRFAKHPKHVKRHLIGNLQGISKRSHHFP